MAPRKATRLPSLAVVGVVVVLASATLAVGASRRMAAAPARASAPVTAPTKTVPDITGQAFVFAKGTLEDAGLAWKVVGPVHGYAANTVAKQFPAAGIKLKDTGTPTITVTLRRSSYPQEGEPEDVSPYRGTSVQRIGLPKTAPAPAPKTATKPAARIRTPDFVVEGAPKEPQKEMPLPQRARLLTAFIAGHSKSPANVRHFLYQNSWVVTGAKFGWFHGAEALRVLIAADRLADRRWGIGRKSELVALAALANVERRSK
jgi:hypothetical protein